MSYNYPSDSRPGYNSGISSNRLMASTGTYRTSSGSGYSSGACYSLGTGYSGTGYSSSTSSSNRSLTSAGTYSTNSGYSSTSSGNSSRSGTCSTASSSTARPSQSSTRPALLNVVLEIIPCDQPHRKHISLLEFAPRSLPHNADMSLRDVTYRAFEQILRKEIGFIPGRDKVVYDGKDDGWITIQTDVSLRGAVMIKIGKYRTPEYQRTSRLFIRRH